LLKGYIDRVFLPGFSMRYHARFPYVEPLLKGRSARVIYTQNSPWFAGWFFRGDLFWQWISGAVLGHCGFRPVRRHALYRAKDVSPDRRAAFLASVRELGRRGT
jgi:putative NADPH-quinone reductase